MISVLSFGYVYWSSIFHNPDLKWNIVQQCTRCDRPLSIALHTRLKVWSGQDCETLDKGLRFQFQLEIHTSLPQMLENNKYIYMSSKRWSTKNNNSFGKGFRNVEKKLLNISHRHLSHGHWPRHSAESPRPLFDHILNKGKSFEEIFQEWTPMKRISKSHFWSGRLF